MVWGQYGAFAAADRRRVQFRRSSPITVVATSLAMWIAAVAALSWARRAIHQAGEKGIVNRRPLRGRQRRRARRGLPLLALLLGVAALTPRSAASAPGSNVRGPKVAATVAPAPLSAAERAGVDLAVQYLYAGPYAWQRRLSPDSPWKQLPPARAAAEIAARVGPPRAARWQLQRPGPLGEPEAVVFSVEYPSGMSETLWLDLVEGDDGFELRSVRTLSEPWPALDDDGDSEEELAGWRPANSRPPQPRAIGLVVAALALAAIARVVTRRRLPRPGAVALAAACLACHGGGATDGDAISAADQPVEMHALEPLRHGLAIGASPGELNATLAASPREGTAGEIARLWRIDRQVRDLQLNEAATLLATFPDPAPYPLAELLRARLAALRGVTAAAHFHYERVSRMGADDDGLRLEIAGAITDMQTDESIEPAYRPLIDMGTRMAVPYYTAAEMAMVDGRDDEAEALFRVAWQLQPMPREELFSSPPLTAAVARRQPLFDLVQLQAADEPAIGGAVPGAFPLTLPPRTTAAVTGQLLRVTVAGAELQVAGGAPLAPAATAVETAHAFDRRRRDGELAQLDQLQLQAREVSSFAQPALLERIELAAEALAEDERWQDLLALTDRLPDLKRRLPPTLAQLRALALVRTDEPSEAFALLLRLAQDDKLHGRKDVGTLYQLADSLVRQQRFDLALKVLRRANARSGLTAGWAREKQVLMEQRLVGAHLSYASKHFRIRYPKVAGSAYAEQVAMVLEEERRRIGHWVPLDDPTPVDVDLYPLGEFLGSYSMDMPVVGLFDGRVRVPFADLHSLHPELVKILSHELAHALITQATGDRAPKWVQEGLAQHVQMVQDVSNPYRDLDNKGRSLSLAVVEHALDGFSEWQLVELSYAQSVWAFHYLEAEHGVDSIHRLLAAYRDGDDTSEALQLAIGMEPPQLDSALRAWAVTGAPRVWPSKLRRYDEEAEQLLVRTPLPPPPARVGPPHALSPKDRQNRKRVEQEARAAAMAAWHAKYQQWSRPLKEAYTPVQQAMAANGWTPDDTARCRQLAATMSEALADPERFRAPDPRVTYSLHAAMITLRDLGIACERGDFTVARSQAVKANHRLAEAAKVLAEYKLAL